MLLLDESPLLLISVARLAIASITRARYLLRSGADTGLLRRSSTMSFGGTLTLRRSRPAAGDGSAAVRTVIAVRPATRAPETPIASRDHTLISKL